MKVRPEIRNWQWSPSHAKYNMATIAIIWSSKTLAQPCWFEGQQFQTCLHFVLPEFSSREHQYGWGKDSHLSNHPIRSDATQTDIWHLPQLFVSIIKYILSASDPILSGSDHWKVILGSSGDISWWVNFSSSWLIVDCKSFGNCGRLSLSQSQELVHTFAFTRISTNFYNINWWTLELELSKFWSLNRE